MPATLRLRSRQALDRARKDGPIDLRIAIDAIFRLRHNYSEELKDCHLINAAVADIRTSKPPGAVALRTGEPGAERPVVSGQARQRPEKDRSGDILLQSAGIASRAARLLFQSAGIPFQSARIPFQSGELLFQSTGILFQAARIPFQSAGIPFQSAGILFQAARIPYRSAGIPFQAGRDAYRP